MKKTLLTTLVILVSCLVGASTLATLSEMFSAGIIGLDGKPLAGGKVYTYLSGTTTPANLYTLSDKSASATNPFTLDYLGRAKVFGDGIYTFIIKSSTGTMVYTINGIAYSYMSDTLAGGITLNGTLMMLSGALIINSSGIGAKDANGVNLSTSDGITRLHIDSLGVVNLPTGTMNIGGAHPAILTSGPVLSIPNGISVSTSFLVSGNLSVSGVSSLNSVVATSINAEQLSTSGGISIGILGISVPSGSISVPRQPYIMFSSVTESSQPVGWSQYVWTTMNANIGFVTPDTYVGFSYTGFVTLNISAPGRFLISVHMSKTIGSGGGSFRLQLIKNGVAIAQAGQYASNDMAHIQLVAIEPCSVGDKLSVLVYNPALSITDFGNRDWTNWTITQLN